MDSLLDRVQAADVRLDPFPHIAVTEALDPALVSRLQEEFPPLEVIAGEQSSANNLRMGLSARDALGNPAVSELWRHFVAYHTSQSFLDDLLEVFGDAVRATYPDLEERIGPLDGLRAGVRGVDEDADVLLDAQISVNTPVTTPTSVRGAHLDDPDKLFAGLFYLRRDDDHSTGGDLELHRYRRGPRGFRGPEIYDTFVEPVRTVRYASNTLVLFVNSPRSLHGVTVRSVTDVPRRFVNLVAKIGEPLFDIAPFQATLRDKVIAGPELAQRRLKALRV